MKFTARLAATLLVSALAAAGCTMDKQSAPTALIGPAGLGIEFNLTASPDILPRDGASVATIKVTARNPEGKPLAGQTLKLAASAGTLSTANVTTNAAGQAFADFTAPALAQGAATATITATPIGGDFDAIRTQAVVVALTGPALPVAAFTFSPAAPGQFDVVTFDASTTTVAGVACGSACDYAWSFGDGTTAKGQITTRRYQSQGVFLVTLTVTATGGVTNSTTQSVTVGAPQPITAAITISPTNPHAGDTVYVDGRGSTTPDGATITDYAWDFGNGETGSGATSSTTYPAVARTYTIRLIITDSRGRTATATTVVTVAVP